MSDDKQTELNPENEHVRLVDSCITQRKDQGPSRSCNESTEEEEEQKKSLLTTGTL